MYIYSGRLKVNMGNIYFKQKNYSRAVKFYRMALDQVPNTHKNMRYTEDFLVQSSAVSQIQFTHRLHVTLSVCLRIKIRQNIGIAFVKLGQYSEAITSFEHVLAEEPNFVTGFNLILCYFAMGDK